jgi:hypothetical protein
MGQDWKTMSLVVLGAAVAGWLAVRALGPGTRPHDASPPTVVAMRAPAASADPEPAVAEEAEIPPVPTASAAAPAAAESDVEVAYIERDLQILAQALVRDQRIEDRVMPRVDDALDVPGVTTYRRAPDFWEPAFAGSGGANR